MKTKSIRNCSITRLDDGCGYWMKSLLWKILSCWLSLNKGRIVIDHLYSDVTGVSTCAHTYTCVHIIVQRNMHVYGWVQVHMYVYPWTQPCAQPHVCTQTCSGTHVYTHTGMCMHVQTCAHTCTCIHRYMHKQIYTGAHTSSLGTS